MDLEAERKRLNELDTSQLEQQTENIFEDNQFADIDLTRKNQLNLFFTFYWYTF